MAFKNVRTVAVLLAVVVAVIVSGCPKKAEVSSVPEPQPRKAEAVATPDADAVKAAEAQRAAEAAAEAARKAEQERAAQEAAAAAQTGLQPVYFDYDRANIRDDAKSVMQGNADYLKAHPAVKVRIEGNCDERGTIEYNQALGQRRAVSAKKFLTAMGISSNRIALISYGKEKPVCAAANEECQQKNRRGDFIPAGE